MGQVGHVCGVRPRVQPQGPRGASSHLGSLLRPGGTRGRWFLSFYLQNKSLPSLHAVGQGLLVPSAGVRAVLSPLEAVTGIFSLGVTPFLSRVLAAQPVASPGWAAGPTNSLTVPGAALKPPHCVLPAAGRSQPLKPTLRWGPGLGVRPGHAVPAWCRVCAGVCLCSALGTAGEECAGHCPKLRSEPGSPLLLLLVPRISFLTGTRFLGPWEGFRGGQAPLSCTSLQPRDTLALVCGGGSWEGSWRGSAGSPCVMARPQFLQDLGQEHFGALGTGLCPALTTASSFAAPAAAGCARDGDGGFSPAASLPSRSRKTPVRRRFGFRSPRVGSPRSPRPGARGCLPSRPCCRGGRALRGAFPGQLGVQQGARETRPPAAAAPAQRLAPSRASGPDLVVL